MSITYTKHPIADVWIGFDDATHTYKLVYDKDRESWEDNDNIFVSGTQFCGHYMPEFNAAAVAPIVARKQGKSPQQVLDEWDAKREASCEMGTRVHANQELMMLGKPPTIAPKSNRERQIMIAGANAIANIMAGGGWTPAAAEKVVFSVKYKVAGTIDAIFTRGRETMVVDWKTNEAIHTASKYNERCKPPLEHLDACEFVKYCLQLSLYRRILLDEGYINAVAPIRLVLVHLQPGAFRAIPVQPMQEVDSLLLDYLCNWRELILPKPPF